MDVADVRRRRVVLIDDDEDVAALVETLVDLDDRFVMAGSAQSAAEGVRLAQEEQPDIIVLDLHLPEMDGVEALPLLREASACPIVVFSAFPDPYTLLDSLRGGADGYVNKASAWSELLPSMAALCGLTYGEPAAQH